MDSVSLSCFPSYHFTEAQLDTVKWSAMAIGIILIIAAIIARFQEVGTGCVASLASVGSLLCAGGLFIHFGSSKEPLSEDILASSPSALASNNSSHTATQDHEGAQ